MQSSSEEGRNSSQLNWYMGANSLWMAGFSLQTLLVTWILVGVLAESPQRVGFAQMIIGVPGLVFMLWGGALGDKVDSRRLLVSAHFLSAIPSFFLALASQVGILSFWILITGAISANLLNAASNPVRNTILNRVAGNRLQYAISLSTGIGSIAAMAGTKLGGEIASLGLANILYFQAFTFIAGGLVCMKLLPAPPSTDSSRGSALADIGYGLEHIWHFKLARDLIALSTLSSFFNAGAWMVAMPFIITRVYGGDALLLANIIVLFTFGSIVANFGLLKFMPLRRPGRLYLLMQLARILALVAIFYTSNLWILCLASFYWGFNMGITTTTSRLMIQEFTSDQFRSRVMSVFTLGIMSSAPVGSLILGQIIGLWGALNALIPALLASILIFTLGIYSRHIWEYESGQHKPTA